MRTYISPAALAVAAVLGFAAWPACLSAAEKDEKTVTLVPDDLEWLDATAPFLPGTKIAILEGHPDKAGPFVYRMKMPAGYKIQPHAHKKAERVTVISGDYRMGLGEKFDQKEAVKLPPGSYIMRPPGTMHYGWAEKETVLQIHGEGPWAAEFANPADNPTKRKK